MKTTIDLPDPLFRRAKATAAVKGVSLKRFITEAVEQRLGTAPKMSMRDFLASLPRVDKETTDQIMRRVAESDADDLAFQQQELEADS
jgi:hypothetical protein